MSISVVQPLITNLTGTSTGNVMNVSGFGSVAIQVTGTPGTMVAQVSMAPFGGAPTTWTTVRVVDINAMTQAASITAAGVYLAPVGGFTHFRVNCTGAATAGYAYAVGTDASIGDFFGGGSGGSADTQYVEDAVSAADPTGTIGLAVANTVPSGSRVSASGDNIALTSSMRGELWVSDVDAITNLQGILAAVQGTLVDNIAPRTTGGLSVFHLESAGTTNATVVKNAAGQLYGWTIYNSNASARKVAFHNASSTPTAGAAILFTVVIPGGALANVFDDIGIPFSTGISITTVTNLTDAGTTAVAADDLNINLFYK